MTKKKELPLLQPSIHTFAITGFIRSNYTANKIYDAMNAAVLENRYKWRGRNCIVKHGGGLRLTLVSVPSRDNIILLDDINLPRLTGDASYLALTDLSSTGLAEQGRVLDQELDSLGITWKDENIRFSLRRLDLTQDFYVKSDPSLMIRNLRFAGETGLYRGLHANHVTACNEKHSAKWESKWYNITVYDKHAEIQNRNHTYHNVPDSDITKSKNRLRYEASLKREFLKKFENMICRQEEMEHFYIEQGAAHYLKAVTPYIPTILRGIASDLFGDHSWQRLSLVREEVNFACRVGTIDEKSCRITNEYLNSLDSSEKALEFPLTPTKEKIIREVLDQLQINRIVIPERILTKRELVRFPCPVLSKYVQGEGKSIDLLTLPKRPWQKSQKIYCP